MTALTAFGLFEVSAMVVCYALERRSRWYILGFAAACVLGSIYGFLQGAWPFGVVSTYGSLRRSLIARIERLERPHAARIEIFDGSGPLPPDVIRLDWGDDAPEGPNL